MTLTQQQIDRAVDQLIRARLQRSQLQQLPEGCDPSDYADAYAIQDGVCRVLGLRDDARIAAWKTGAANASVTPFVAPIAPSLVFANASRLPGGDFHEIGAEAELAYRLGRDLPSRQTPYSEREVREAIACIEVTIEIIDSRMRHWRDQTACWQLADNQMNGALIVGDRCLDWQAIDHSRQQALLLVDGEVAVSATASNSVGDPFTIMTSAVNQTVHRAGGLRAGDIFTAGSWTGTHFVRPGCEIVARFPGIGEARVILEQ